MRPPAGSSSGRARRPGRPAAPAREVLPNATAVWSAQSLEQPTVGGPEPVPATERHGDPPELAIPRCAPARAPLRRAPPSRRATPQVPGHGLDPGDVQRGPRAARRDGTRSRLGDGREELVGVGRLREAAAEVGQRLVGLGPGAVRRPVGQPDQLTGEVAGRRARPGRSPAATTRTRGPPFHQLTGDHDECRVADRSERRAGGTTTVAADDHVEVVELGSAARRRRRGSASGRTTRTAAAPDRPRLLAAVDRLPDEAETTSPTRCQSRGQRDQPELLPLLAVARRSRISIDTSPSDQTPRLISMNPTLEHLAERTAPIRSGVATSSNSVGSTDKTAARHSSAPVAGSHGGVPPAARQRSVRRVRAGTSGPAAR